MGEVKVRKLDGLALLDIDHNRINPNQFLLPFRGIETRATAYAYAYEKSYGVLPTQVGVIILTPVGFRYSPNLSITLRTNGLIDSTTFIKQS